MDELMSLDEALAEVRALFRYRSEFDRLLSEAIERACMAGVPRIELARSLGVHRATFYRQFPDVLQRHPVKP